jgi:hypothetical protein
MNPFFNFLVASPNFLEGIARVLDFGDTLTQYNYSLTEEQADRIAVGSDWHFVGLDLKSAIEDFRKRFGQGMNRERPTAAY